MSTSPRKTTAREVAARVVERVIDEGAFSQHALSAELDRAALVGGDRGFATELAYGTLTWRLSIDQALESLLPRGLESLRSDVRAVLRVGVYQLRWRAEEVPAWSAVDEAVRTVRSRWGSRTAGLVNGVLRNVGRRGDALFPAVVEPTNAEELAARWALPAWIAEELSLARDVGGAHQTLAAMSGRSPLHLRARSGDGAELAIRLQGDGASAHAHAVIPTAATVDGAISTVAGALDAGVATVQDAAAQLVALTLPADLQGCVLDACAGAGGKSMHLLDRLTEAHVLASDRGANRLGALTRAAGDREGRLSVAVWDMPDPTPEAVDKAGPFSAVVLDAPCTGLGTLGRHPEVRWNRSRDDLRALTEVQSVLLDAVAPLVAPNGWLIYAVCTLTRSEGPEQIAAFVARHPEFTLAPPTAATADGRVEWDALVDAAGVITLWPDVHGTDGFFVARLRRAA